MLFKIWGIFLIVFFAILVICKLIKSFVIFFLLGLGLIRVLGKVVNYRVREIEIIDLDYNNVLLIEFNSSFF